MHRSQRLHLLLSRRLASSTFSSPSSSSLRSSFSASSSSSSSFALRRLSLCSKAAFCPELDSDVWLWNCRSSVFVAASICSSFIRRWTLLFFFGSQPLLFVDAYYFLGGSFPTRPMKHAPTKEIQNTNVIAADLDNVLQRNFSSEWTPRIRHATNTNSKKNSKQGKILWPKLI